jgi:hypothetical protein
MLKNFIFIAILLAIVNCSFGQTASKPRTIITTDGEIDDVDSFVRMLLYTNEFHLEGLIYSSSMWHYKGDGKGTKIISEMDMTKQMYGEKTDLRWPGTKWMDDLILAYKKVYPNLIKHDKNYPKPNYLQSIVKVGNINFEGDMKEDTEGSNYIKRKLLDKAPQPIYLQAWGGTNTIARALLAIEKQYNNSANWAQIKAEVSKKAIIYTISYQDATIKNYIAQAWPGIKILCNSTQFACLAYPWKRLVPADFQPYFEGNFMKNEIIKNHGPLLEKYYSYGDGQKQVGDEEHIHGDSLKLTNAQWGSFEKYDFISEGDSPAFLYLVDVGLGNFENPDFGGWSGRMVKAKDNPNNWTDGPEVVDYNVFTQKKDDNFPQSRWLQVLQNDFAARADWSVLPFEKANHAPKILLKSKDKLTLKPGQETVIIANANDPDHNKVATNFWLYKEAGTGKEMLEISKISEASAKIKLPKSVIKGEVYHIIIECKDDGAPNLTRYKRVIIKVV